MVTTNDVVLRKIWRDIWRRFLHSMNWGVSEASQKLGLPVSTVNNWLRAQSVPNLRALTQIYLATGIDITRWFFEALQQSLNDTKENESPSQFITVTSGDPSPQSGIYRCEHCCSVVVCLKDELLPRCSSCGSTTWELVFVLQ